MMTQEELASDLRVVMSVECGVEPRMAAFQRIYDTYAEQRAEIDRLREAMERIVESEGLWTKNDMAYEAQQALRESTK